MLTTLLLSAFAWRLDAMYLPEPGDVDSIDDLVPEQHTAVDPWLEHSNFEALVLSDLVGSMSRCSPHLVVACHPAAVAVCHSTRASAL